MEDNAREWKKSRTKDSTDTESGEVSENGSDMSCTDHSNGDDAEALLIGAKTSKQDNAGSVKDHSDPNLVKVFDELDQEYNCTTLSQGQVLRNKLPKLSINDGQHEWI